MEQQKATNLPYWWSVDVERTGDRLKEEVKKHFPGDQENKMLYAMAIAHKYHEHQERVDGAAYVVHTYRVALSLLLELQESSFELVTAALLHDLLEDTTYTPKKMKADFGEEVENLVNSITRQKNEKRSPKGDRLTDGYFKKIIKSGVNSIKLKLADKLDNIRDALNHPKPQKRQLYIRECQTVFLPLLKYLENPALEEKIHGLLEEAMRNHPCYIDQLLLFNPGLDYWIISDHVQRVKIPLNPGFTAVDLVKSVAASIIDRINNNRLDSLHYIANLPDFLDSPGKKDSWEKVKIQLIHLVELLSTDNPSQWLKPLMTTPGYLLAVVHSRLFMPANRLFPLWQKDYGDYILKTNRDLYLSMYHSETGKTEKWLAWLHLLLIHREALWRYITGNGAHTAKIIVSEIKKVVQSYPGEEYALLVSMRLLSEYLDVKTDTCIRQAYVEKEFLKLWQQLNKPEDTSFDVVDKKVEIIGFEKVRHLCPGLKTRLFSLRSILEEYIYKEITDDITNEALLSVWISFNVPEIQKRLQFFNEALKRVEVQTAFKDLKEIGIHVQIDRLENVLVFTVKPDKWDALKNRIPEITDKQREEIRASDYSAVTIFDTLLKKKLEKAEKEPIWMPRVYRILDTMADFDPANVQPIKISFQAEEKIGDANVYLPIPKETGDPGRQKKRKEITARYIVTMIYNHVVTLGIHSAAVDCSPLDEQKQQLGFKNQELENMLGKLAVKLNYENQYSRYVEKFNFKKFSIRSALRNQRPAAFTDEDINYGLFMGIDIGGTDTKISFFYKGDIAFKQQPLLKFSTFDTRGRGFPVSARLFCQRIIDEVDTYLKGNVEFNWEDLQGVGISWTGGVRNSRVVTYSKMLQKLSFDDGGKTININPESSPVEVHSVDFAGVFYQGFQKKIKNNFPSFVVALENDGNSEAYGNYCFLTKTSKKNPGGKLIIKLGTSTAGGYVNPSSALSPLVTEFAKIILDFNIKEDESTDEIQGPVREFVSSIAVRQLSRTFKFNGELVFGPLVCKCCHTAMNETDFQKTRLEAIEIGKLINFFTQIREPGLKEDFLKELAESDNQYANASYEKLVEILTSSFRHNRKKQAMFIQYVKDRGKEEYNRIYKDDDEIDKPGVLIWKLGLSRLRLISQLEFSLESYGQEQIPSNFDFKTFSQKILGSVALFSQISLHIAHLVAALYNIFKKERFNEVILSGGVLRDETGKVIVKQTEAFLAKYYDKIFGLQKHLKPGSMRLVSAGNHPDIIAPFGAAMLANRIHKINSLAVMEKEIDYRVKKLKPGDTLSIKQLENIFKDSRVKKEDIREYLELLISGSILLPQDEKEEVYVKAFIPG